MCGGSETGKGSKPIAQRLNAEVYSVGRAVFPEKVAGFPPKGVKLPGWTDEQWRKGCPVNSVDCTRVLATAISKATV